MLTLKFSKDNLIFKDVVKENLEQILNLYNQNERNIYATGIDRLMSIEDIQEKYLEVLVSSYEFFTGIFLKDSAETENVEKDGTEAVQSEKGCKLIGVVKGRIDYENSEEAWISSVLIDNCYQHQGIGTKTVNAIVSHLNQAYDVKRLCIGIISGNSIGRCFWQNLGFNYLRTIEQYMTLNQHAEDFIIMKKEIGQK